MLEELHSDLSSKLKTPTRHFTKLTVSLTFNSECTSSTFSLMRSPGPSSEIMLIDAERNNKSVERGREKDKKRELQRNTQPK